MRRPAGWSGIVSGIHLDSADLQKVDGGLLDQVGGSLLVVVGQMHQARWRALGTKPAQHHARVFGLRARLALLQQCLREAERVELILEGARRPQDATVDEEPLDTALGGANHGVAREGWIGGQQLRGDLKRQNFT